MYGFEFRLQHPIINYIYISIIHLLFTRHGSTETRAKQIQREKTRSVQQLQLLHGLRTQHCPSFHTRPIC